MAAGGLQLHLTHEHAGAEILRKAPGIFATAPDLRGRNSPLEEHAASLSMPRASEARGELFFVRVKGESMVPTLWEGDYLLVRQQPAVENEAIAVALIEGELVVKRVVRTGHHLTLKPDNDTFPPLVVILRQQTVQILGKAVGVYRML
jgi:SOS-response transcriptional repressor LexA